MRKKMFQGAAMALFGALSGIPAAQAAALSYDAVALGGKQWRYDYTLQLDAADAAFDELTIYFDTPEITTISDFSAPVGWDVLAIQPDPALPDAGFFDALHMPGRLSGPATLGRFSVSFTAAADGVPPASQRYELLLSETLQPVWTGQTMAAVPEPEIYALLLSGLGVVALSRRRLAARTAQREEA